ncbi:hypothetical protein [Pseudoxanthomonas sp.]|jgi:hypothetical protein|uniref:hypothetical protein n=1 Tax=Pseudoxanthomonas sp. TaxID=1871049 RepID=UPI002E0EFD75|nr:hypothetical protein [Pseudoxanthomonas sp.]
MEKGLRIILWLVCAMAAIEPAMAAKRIPLTDAHYSGAVTAQSSASVVVESTTFTPDEQTWSDLAMAGGMYIPVFGKTKTEFFFNPPDQEALASILAAELERVGIFAPTGTAAQAVMPIRLIFKKGTYRHADNTYTLDVAMAWTDAHGVPIEKNYTLNSHARLTRWQKLNTSVWQGKMYLVREALDVMIPDIQQSLNGEAPEKQVVGAASAPTDQE